MVLQDQDHLIYRYILEPNNMTSNIRQFHEQGKLVYKEYV